MKTIAFELLNKKFDDQYTFDLQGYLTFQEFNSHMKILNQSIKRKSLPRHLHFRVKLLWMIWVASACVFYVIHMHDLPLWIILLLASSLLLATLLFICHYHYSVFKFESSILAACEHLNETEKTRGIEYQLVKNGQHYHSCRITFAWGCLFGAQSFYEMVIRCDDDQRYSKEFVSVPLYSSIPPVLLPDNEKANDVNTPFLSSGDDTFNNESMST
ncbi:hypothetical protein BC941DRAFT_468634 [Chlamydoabsidia padenii]|nr:hypothetical protein BC941DRAFT_468634 [Chlamydoabsidia padenii]